MKKLVLILALLALVAHAQQLGHSGPGGGSTGGSVTVTNFPATQPVSLAAAVDVSDRAARLLGHVNVDNFPATQPVSGTFWQATQPVSGTFWQATQPVSLAAAVDVSDRAARLLGHVNVDNFPATQPVSLAAAVDVSDRAARLLGHTNVDNFPATQPVSIAAAVDVSDRAARLLGTVTGPTLTKGTQGSTGFSTQDLKDAGRVLKVYSASAVTGATTEALITLTPYADLTAGSTGTTFAVTAGKRLRLQSMTVTWRNNTAVAGGVTVRCRMLNGTVLVASPVMLSLNSTTSLATIGSGATTTVDFPDGMELSGTMQFGLTQLAVGAVVGFDVHVIGYEY